MKSSSSANKKSELLFSELAEELSKENPEIKTGKMMSSSGLKYKDKFFCFLYNDKMCFRLGRDFDINSTGVKKYELLNPFKSKPPLKDWFVLEISEKKHWYPLAKSSYEQLKNIAKKK
jgi:hypothetical protein